MPRWNPLIDSSPLPRRPPKAEPIEVSPTDDASSEESYDRDEYDIDETENPKTLSAFLSTPNSGTSHPSVDSVPKTTTKEWKGSCRKPYTLTGGVKKKGSPTIEDWFNKLLPAEPQTPKSMENTSTVGSEPLDFSLNFDMRQTTMGDSKNSDSIDLSVASPVRERPNSDASPSVPSTAWVESLAGASSSQTRTAEMGKVSRDLQVLIDSKPGSKGLEGVGAFDSLDGVSKKQGSAMGGVTEFDGTQNVFESTYVKWLQYIRQERLPVIAKVLQEWRQIELAIQCLNMSFATVAAEENPVLGGISLDLRRRHDGSLQLRQELEQLNQGVQECWGVLGTLAPNSKNLTENIKWPHCDLTMSQENVIPTSATEATQSQDANIHEAADLDQGPDADEEARESSYNEGAGLEEESCRKSTVEDAAFSSPAPPSPQLGRGQGDMDDNKTAAKAPPKTQSSSTSCPSAGKVKSSGAKRPAVTPSRVTRSSQKAKRAGNKAAEIPAKPLHDHVVIEIGDDSPTTSSRSSPKRRRKVNDPVSPTVFVNSDITPPKKKARTTTMRGEAPPVVVQNEVVDDEVVPETVQKDEVRSLRGCRVCIDDDKRAEKVKKADWRKEDEWAQEHQRRLFASAKQQLLNAARFKRASWSNTRLERGIAFTDADKDGHATINSLLKCSSERNPWVVLRIGTKRSQLSYDEAKARYKKWVKRVHPDKNPHPLAKEAFHILDSAWKRIESFES